MSVVVNEFFSGFFLWRDAILAAIVVSILCGWLGVYIILKRIVFVSATLPQASGLGIALSFFLGSFIGPHGHDAFFFLKPVAMAIWVSGIAAAIFSLDWEHRKVTGDTIIAITYVLCSALVMQILNSPRIIQEAHEIGDILFGNAVVIDRGTLRTLLIASAVIIIFHFAAFKEIVAVMFDREVAATLGLKVKRIGFALFISIAIAVSVSTRAIGALPVFGFMILPPAASLMLTRRLRLALVLSMGIGVFSAFFGYMFSYVLNLPTGPTMIAVAALWLIPGIILKR